MPQRPASPASSATRPDRSRPMTATPGPSRRRPRSGRARTGRPDEDGPGRPPRRPGSAKMRVQPLDGRWRTRIGVVDLATRLRSAGRHQPPDHWMVPGPVSQPGNEPQGRIEPRSSVVVRSSRWARTPKIANTQRQERCRRRAPRSTGMGTASLPPTIRPAARRASVVRSTPSRCPTPTRRGRGPSGPCSRGASQPVQRSTASP